MAVYIGSVCEPGAGLTGGPAWGPVRGTLIWAGGARPGPQPGAVKWPGVWLTSMWK
jgi:hypothetical protein